MKAPRIAALVLAAGQGTRMRSRLPKVLHRCVDLPLVAHVVRLALARKCDPIVVVVDPTHGAAVEQNLKEFFPNAPLRFAVQQRPLGTGDAARAGLAALPKAVQEVLILYGDVPLLTPKTVARLARAARGRSLALLSARLADPTGYGRVVRNSQNVARIVEHKDATDKERAIDEVNAGVYLCKASLLRRGLSRLSANNAQGEIYLTDIVALAAAQRGARAVQVEDAAEVRGVNTRAELAAAEATLRARVIAEHQERGVTFRDPSGAFVGVEVELAPDVEIGVGVQLLGRVKVARGAHILGPTVVKDSVVGADVTVEAFSHIEGARLARGAHVGPFARLRPGAELAEGARVGNFVELKKTRLGRGAKANHLAYLGDAQVGAKSNVGAGTITCNYDGGPHKHATLIGEGSFIGSNSTLVAPLTLGTGTYVAAGSVVTRDVPADALALGRARQVNRDGYASKLRKRINKKSEG